MADKKVENKDLVKGNPFQPTQDDALNFKKALDSLNESLNNTKEGLKDVLKEHQKLSKTTPFEGYDNIKKVEQAIQQVEKASEELSNNEKAAIKIRQRLTDATEEEAKELALLREQLRRQNKELRDNAKATLDSNDAYQVLTKQFRDAQKELKSVSAEFGVNSKEAKKAEKELNRVAKRFEEINQKARDGRIFVGQYDRALSKVRGTLRLIAASGVVAALTGLVEAFKASDEGADTFSQGIGRVTLTLGAFVKSLFQVGTAIKNGKGILDAFSDGFANFGDGLDKAFDALDEQIRLTRVLRKAQANAGVELERLNTQVQFYQSLSDSSKISLTEQRIATALLTSALIEQNDIQTKLAKTQLEVARAGFAAKQTTETLEALRAAETNLIRVQNEALAITAERFKKNAELISDAAELELDIALDVADNQKTVNERRITNEEEFLGERKRLTEENEKIIEDSFAFQVEIFEKNQTLINKGLARQFKREEKVLSSRLERNQEVINSNNRLIASMSKDEAARIKNSKQIEKLSEQNKKINEDNLLLESRVNDSREKQARLNAAVVIDTNELINESNLKTLNNTIKGLGLSESLQIRLLEVIRDRKTALQDLEETQNDLNNTLREARSIDNDIIAQGEALSELVKKNTRFQSILEELERKRNENRKTELEDRLREIETERSARQNALQVEIFNLEESEKKQRQVFANGKELSREETKTKVEELKKQLKATEGATEEELKLRQKLLEQLIEEEAAAGRKIIEQRIKIQRAASEVLTGFSEKFFEGQLNRLDEQLEAVRKRSDEIRELSQRNVQSAGDALAFQQRREAELQRERERERKRQQKSKLLFAILDTVTAKAAAGDPNPVQSAVLDTTFIRALVENFPTFFEGTDLTGNGNIDNKGGFLSVLHPNETVLSARDRTAMGNPLSRKDIIANYNIGKSITEVNKGGFSNEIGAAILSKLDSVNATIKGKPVNTSVELDVIENMVTRVVQSNNNKSRYLKKYNNRH